MINLRNKIGQMLIMGFSGTVVDEHHAVAHWLKNDGLGGVILFDYDLQSGKQGKNIVEQAQIKHLIHQLNHFSRQALATSDPLPLLTAIDYEGGAVDRLSKVDGCMNTMAASKQAVLSPPAFVEEIRQMAETLQSLGFNLNFAPVVDLDFKQSRGIIGHLKRCFSNNASEVSRLAKKFVEIFNQKGIACAYKHFPGHGSATGDTHKSFVDVTESFRNSELQPYQQLMNDANDAVMIMTAHVINRQLDESGLPATLSSKILTDLLRKTYGYKGIIISDDLQMQAIASHYPIDEALALTINAGADMMIFGNQLGWHSAPDIIDRIEQLVHRDIVSQARINEAYSRVVRLKKELDCLKI